jgi:hypothetical protein
VGHRRPEGGGRRPWGWPGRAGAHHSEDAGSGWRLVDDRLLGGEEVVLRLVNLSGQGTLVLPSKGRRADLLLGRDSLGLGSNESHGESAVGCSGTGRRRDRAQHAEGRDDVRKRGRGGKPPVSATTFPTLAPTPALVAARRAAVASAPEPARMAARTTTEVAARGRVRARARAQGGRGFHGCVQGGGGVSTRAPGRTQGGGVGEILTLARARARVEDGGGIGGVVRVRGEGGRRCLGRER